VVPLSVFCLKVFQKGLSCSHPSIALSQKEGGKWWFLSVFCLRKIVETKGVRFVCCVLFACVFVSCFFFVSSSSFLLCFSCFSCGWFWGKLLLGGNLWAGKEGWEGDDSKNEERLGGFSIFSQKKRVNPLFSLFPTSLLSGSSVCFVFVFFIFLFFCFVFCFLFF
jgi:hypothetical protein